MRIIPALDEIEQRHLCFRMRFESIPVKQFAFECGEEALAHRVYRSSPLRIPSTAARRPGCIEDQNQSMCIGTPGPSDG